MNILFVCTGNTCRSPMAQALLEDIAKERDLDIAVKSAGVFAFDGQSVSQEAVQALEEEGIDISSHRASMIHRELLEDSDLILTMAKSHKEALISKYPFLREKVFTLKEYAYGIEEDILDPFGQGLDVYRNTKAEIKRALDEIIAKGGFLNEDRYR